MDQKTMQALVFLGFTHFMIHVFSQLLPAIIPILREEMGITLIQASLLVSIPLIVQVIFYLPSGMLSVTKSAIVLGLSFIVTCLGALIVTGINTYIGLILGFGLIGLGSTLYHPPALKAVSEVDPDKLSLAMAIQSAGGSFGFSAGPLLLGFLLPFFGWRISFYLWMPLIIITSYYSYQFISKTEKGLETTKTEFFLIKEILHRRFILIILVGALTDAAFINATTYFTTYLTDIRGLTPGFASILFGIGPLMGVFGSLFGGLLGDRLGKLNAFLISIILIGAFLLIIPFTPGLVLLSIFYVLWRLFYSAFLPLMNVMVSDNSQPRTRGMAFSVFFILSNIISAMTPGLGAYVADIFGIESIFTMSVIMLIPGILLTSRLKYDKKLL